MVSVTVEDIVRLCWDGRIKIFHEYVTAPNYWESICLWDARHSEPMPDDLKQMRVKAITPDYDDDGERVLMLDV